LISPIAITPASHQFARKIKVFGDSAQLLAESTQSNSAHRLLELSVRLDPSGSIEMNLYGHDGRDPSCDELAHASRVHRNYNIRHGDLTCHLVGSL